MEMYCSERTPTTKLRKGRVHLGQQKSLAVAKIRHWGRGKAWSEHTMILPPNASLEILQLFEFFVFYKLWQIFPFDFWHFLFGHVCLSSRTSQVSSKLGEVRPSFACFELVLNAFFQKVFWERWGMTVSSSTCNCTISLSQLFLAKEVLDCLLASCGEAAPYFGSSLLTVSELFPVFNISSF